MPKLPTIKTTHWLNQEPVESTGTDFPHGALERRIKGEVESALSTWPWLFVVPVLTVVVGTALALWVSSPPVVVRFVIGVVGSLSGLGVAWVVLWRRFRVRYLRDGDPLFQAGAVHPTARILYPLGLTYRGDVGFDASSLGSYEAYLKHPTGEVTKHVELKGDRVQRPTLFLFIFNPLPPGQYEARWYLTPSGGRRHEIGRAILIDPKIVYPNVRPGTPIPRRR